MPDPQGIACSRLHQLTGIGAVTGPGAIVTGAGGALAGGLAGLAESITKDVGLGTGYQTLAGLASGTTTPVKKTVDFLVKKKLADKTILYNADLEKELAPGESKNASLTALKLLTNTDEIELNNDVEITEVTRTAKTGRKVTPKYTSLYDRGETVTITTPTGENKNYILITIVAISFFVILGTGIVFIKKKILK